MKNFLAFFAARSGNNRFDRYYSGIARSGAGYPTADEARKDMANHRTSQSAGWTIR